MNSDYSGSIENYSFNSKGIFNFDAETAALHGDLSVVTIENLMQLVSHAQLSGDLHLVSSDNAACFVVRNGELVFSYLQSNFTRIGQRLFDGGHISTRDLMECVELYIQKKGKLRFGEIFVSRGLITFDILEKEIKEQIKDCFFKVLEWNAGSFAFIVNELPPEEDVQLSERIDHLVIEGLIAIEKH